MLTLLVTLQSVAFAPAQPPTDGAYHLTPRSAAVREGPEVAPPADDAILLWNEAALVAIRTSRRPPPLAARNLAIVHVAVFDAVNAVARTHQPYLPGPDAPPGTSAELAAAVAAHRVLSELYPKRAGDFDDLLRRCCADVPEGDGKVAGVTVGQAAAERILTRRAGDGSARQARHAPLDGPGRWRPTPPDFTPALLPTWPLVECFCMRKADQFRPPAPPAISTRAYAEAFAEVRRLGGRDSRDRTREQSEIAHFWADGAGTVTPPGHWNRIAQVAVREHGGSLAENARVFALLNLALADAGIACWDAKYHFDLWRPIHGIREADADGNPDTDPDPVWTPLLPTPPFPTYTSGHSTFSGAAAAVLAAQFGDAVAFASESDGLPGVTRSFRSFSAAASEAGRSRIYGGIHWEFDNSEGLRCGRLVGEYVTRYYLRPRPTPGR
jgi:hypothetical protein